MRRLWCSVLSTVLLLFLVAIPTTADPADWGESDWYKFVEMTVSVTLDKVHGGIKGIPGLSPVNGRIPAMDAYAALSAAGSSVKPGLTVWLQAKMRAAEAAGDYQRLNGYQAYYTALVNGDKGPLLQHLRKVQADLDAAEAERQAQALVLNDVIASAGPSGRVEVVPQFTVKGNARGEVTQVQYYYMLRGPKTSFMDEGHLPLRQPQGYQAGLFATQLPKTSPTGRYTLGLWLKDSRGLSTDIVKAEFSYIAKAEEPTKESEPVPPDEPKAPEEPPQESEPVTPPAPRTEPPSEPPELTIERQPPSPPAASRFGVTIAGPRQVSKGQKVAFSPVLKGQPVEPVDYTWSVKGRSIHKRSVGGKFDSSGLHTVRLLAKDSAGTTASATLQVRVKEPEPLRVQISAPARAKAGIQVTLAARVFGGKPPYTYLWHTDGHKLSRPSITVDYDTPGEHAAVLRVKDSLGAEGRGSVVIKVAEGIAINVAGPRRVPVGETATFVPVVANGPKSGYTYHWEVDGRVSKGPTFSATFDTPGNRTMILTARHPDHPPYSGKRVIVVTEAKATKKDRLQVQVSGPSQAQTGDAVAFQPVVRGGSPPYRYSWLVKGKQVAKKSIKGRFEKPGRQTITLRVYDSGKHKSSPAVANHSLVVKESDGDGLRVSIQGPTQVRVGEKVSFAPGLQGGQGPFRYEWQIKGKSVSKPKINGKFDKAGVQRVALRVYDSAAHSSKPVTASLSVKVTAPPAAKKENGRPAKASEFVGDFSVTYITSSSPLPSYYPTRFMLNGQSATNRNGKLDSPKPFRLVNGILTWRGSSGPLTITSPKSFVWVYTKDGKRMTTTFYRDGWTPSKMKTRTNPGSLYGI